MALVCRGSWAASRVHHALRLPLLRRSLTWRSTTAHSARGSMKRKFTSSRCFLDVIFCFALPWPVLCNNDVWRTLFYIVVLSNRPEELSMFRGMLVYLRVSFDRVCSSSNTRLWTTLQLLFEIRQNMILILFIFLCATRGSKPPSRK
jgi:hypothetical protein